MQRERVVVGLSGGVDSAVAAWLLKRAGHEVVGVFMKNWEETTDPEGSGDDDAYCSSRQDFLDAAAVADVIGIELEHVNFAAEYRERVFAEFLREHEAGRTPNPDVLCNAEIKFRAFLDHALRLGASRIATGHYARVRAVAGSAAAGPSPGGRRPAGGQERSDAGAFRYELLKGLDPLKDQSYFLHRLTQEQLARTWFPVGELAKTEVRRLAAEIGLPNARKKDSTGICFIGERPFRAFLNRYLANRPGPVKDDRGRTIGEHVGLSFYTIGQRKGIGIGGVKERGAKGGSEHAPWFVARKDMATNTLWVVPGHDHPWLQSGGLVAADTSWIAGAPPAPGAFAAKTRYRQADAPCRFAPRTDGGFALRFDAAQWAVTPGQSAVLYDGEVCLGGGVIAQAQAVAEAAAAAALSMYLPKHFAEERTALLHAAVRAHPLGLLVTQGPGGLDTNPVPFLLDADPAPHGTLRAHVARANPVWREAAGSEVVVVFQGPQAYVSPSWYASKAEHGKVVPTWNYIVVQARGVLRAVDDAVWLRGLVERLTERHESGRAQPWAVGDAPHEYVGQMLRAIVGLEIGLTALVGKWKMSQNRGRADREGVAAGCDAQGDEASRAVAAAVRAAAPD